MPTGPKGEKHSADAGYIRCSSNLRSALRCFADGRRLRPYCTSRRAASSSLKPVTDVPSR